MLRGCLAALVLLALFIGGYFLWLDTVFDRPGSFWGACGVGLVAFFGVGALQNAYRAFKDWKLVAAAQHGMPAKNGRLLAVTGTIHPLGEPLVAPFSGETCTIVEYDLTSHQRIENAKDPHSAGSDYAGFLMTPCAVQSPVGEVRLLGFPILEGFDDQLCAGYAAARNARDFLTTAQFEDRTGVRMLSLLSVFGDVWSDDDGHVEKNLRIGKTKLTEIFPDELDADLDRFTEWEERNPNQATTYREMYNLASPAHDSESADNDADWEATPDEELAEEGLADPPAKRLYGFKLPVPRMKEKRVGVGETVCAIGIYDELRQGLCPPRGSTRPNRLLRGSAQEIETRCRSSLVSNLFGGLLTLVVVNAAVFGVMQLYLHSPDTVNERTGKAFAAVEKNDLFALQQLQRRKFDVAHATNSEGQTLLMRVKDPTIARWLIEQGADVEATDPSGATPLIHAARTNQADVARELLEAGAKADYAIPSTGRTALMEADNYRSFEVADLLRKSGVRDDIVTMQNGEPLPADGGPQLRACKEYLAALQAHDIPRLKQLVSSDNTRTWDGDWDFSQLTEVAAFEGFVRGDHATLRLFGTNANGEHGFRNFQLRREDGEWKIVSEMKTAF